MKVMKQLKLEKNVPSVPEEIAFERLGWFSFVIISCSVLHLSSVHIEYIQRIQLDIFYFNAFGLFRAENSR